ncbi:hypothetical protein NPIL_378891 [Nephila pilipes]|uniref:Uncharacterized protein n=1 Tax=Nephila pilipes TaxID=299642 RepID=A0A8X6Q3R4_NEPPI|nr:hypothetical protein NPIL_378891 [Nephila pilipes]
MTGVTLPRVTETIASTWATFPSRRKCSTIGRYLSILFWRAETRDLSRSSKATVKSMISTSPDFFVRTRSGIKIFDNPGNFLLMVTEPTDDGMAQATRF